MDQASLSDYASTIQIFVQRNVRWPSELSEEQSEVLLALWLEQRRQDLLAGRMTHLDHAKLASTIPGWKTSAEQRWLKQARAFSDVILLEGFDALRQGHPFLNGWINGQATLSRLGSLDRLHASWLDRHAPGWMEQAVGWPALNAVPKPMN